MESRGKVFDHTAAGKSAEMGIAQMRKKMVVFDNIGLDRRKGENSGRIKIKKNDFVINVSPSCLLSLLSMRGQRWRGNRLPT